jgi:hypothetical protein
VAADVDVTDGIAGVTLTALSSLPARWVATRSSGMSCAASRRLEVRTEIANVCPQMADKF